MTEHSGPVLEKVEGFEVIHCLACGFAHVLPLPTPEELRELYQEAFYSTEKPLYLAEAEEDRDWWDMVHGETLGVLQLESPHPRCLLDVGSGPGHFLRLAMERGWKALGIEPSRRAAEHAQRMGCAVVNDFLTEEVASTLGSFGAIHLREVLEHLPDPAGMLSLCHGLLDPGGIICVVVPNDFNPLQRLLKEEMGYPAWWVAPHHHLNYFNRTSLPQLLNRVGFEVVHLTTTFPMEVFLLMGERYVGDAVLGRAVHAKRKALELCLDQGGLWDQKREIYKEMARWGIGRELVLYARR